MGEAESSGVATGYESHGFNVLCESVDECVASEPRAVAKEDQPDLLNIDPVATALGTGTISFACGLSDSIARDSMNQNSVS